MTSASSPAAEASHIGADRRITRMAIVYAARAIKCDVTEVRQASQCELHEQPQQQDRVDARDDSDKGPERQIQELHQSTRPRPNRPCGRYKSNRIKTMNARIGLYLGSTPPSRPVQVESSIARPRASPAVSAPKALP